MNKCVLSGRDKRVSSAQWSVYHDGPSEPRLHRGDVNTGSSQLCLQQLSPDPFNTILLIIT